ncbi:hypothetical protein CROQUDRAFT_56941 [Cronartium quercuum f. sp. fusiforme G11]|uniref:Metallo-beta-lactamase domain-containing protein n=1 Tax=Cronartium quercuum f. sp. fusiforme G11 TaxID=708437 RepID=A0A9P6TGC8_9BASI|nr:hypothetical protein CROQUDRAFT_56941 [Cronartium quercuum f. sp. fusiforme G11]
MSLVVFNQQAFFKPRPRPSRFLNRSLESYKLTPSQTDHLHRHRFVPRVEKRVRPTNMNRAASPPDQIELNFLGTSAGKPTTFRNPSSLAVRMDGDIWMFDCGEATTHQMMRTTLKASHVKKIFITHLHGDHILGLISFLAHIGDRIETDLMSDNEHPFSDPTSVVEIYGPSGIREFVRTNLRLTQTHSTLRVQVHELLRMSTRDRIYGPSLSQPTGSPGRLWRTEILGRDIWADEEGVWRSFVGVEETGVCVSAAPIAHRIDCVGYLLVEANRREKFDMKKLNPILQDHEEEIKQMGFRAPQAILSKLEKERQPITLSTGIKLEPPKLSIPGRRLVILGDTSDPSPILALTDPVKEPIDLLVHEATGTAVVDIDPSRISAQDTEESVSKKMRERGHSSSFMAGQFARRINARHMILNHVGGKFPSPMGCICPSEEIQKVGKQVQDSCLKATHASLWKSYEQMEEERKKKVRIELKWIRTVAEDAVKGWREGAKDGEEDREEVKVMVAHDFLQVKVPRVDLVSNFKRVSLFS